MLHALRQQRDRLEQYTAQRRKGDSVATADSGREATPALKRLPRVAAAAVAMVWGAARKELIASTLLQLVSSAAIVIQLLAARSVLGSMLRGATIRDLLPAVLSLAAATGAGAAALVVRSGLQQLLGELVGQHALLKVTNVAWRMDLIASDTPEHHDRLQRALMSALSRPVQLTSGLTSLTSSAFTVAGLAIAMLTIEPRLLALAVFATVPVLAAALLSGRSTYDFNHRQTERDRRRSYVQFLLTQRDASKEVRAFSLGDFLQGQQRDLYDVRFVELRELLRLRRIRGVAAACVTGLMTAGAILYLAWLANTGRLTTAEAATVGAASLLLVSQLQTMVAGIGQLYESSLFIHDFTSFMEHAPTDTTFTGSAMPPATFELIEAKDVWFTYPGRAAPALCDVSVRLAAGSVVALVGENGSGKSTLAKVLAGLYMAQSGSVTWNGVNVMELDAQLMRSRITVLFQDFVRYQLSAMENIALGRVEAFDDIDRARSSARSVNIETMLDRLHEGFDTQLGPEYAGGVDLSGGEWQRIGFARALFRDAPLVILDEPTAALDPRAEAALFDSMHVVFEGRTVLMTTHRFSSVRRADYIYVLSAGRVVEEGTHDALIARGGHYAELYTLQASTYLK